MDQFIVGCGQKDWGIKPPSLWFVNDLPYRVIHIHPYSLAVSAAILTYGLVWKDLYYIIYIYIIALIFLSICKTHSPFK